MNISTIEYETAHEVVRQSRRQKGLAKHRWIAIVVGLPTLLAVIYYGFIASPIYVSQSSFVIKSPTQKSVPGFSLANLVQTSGLSAGQEQTNEVLQYIRSRNALRDLQAEIDVRSKFSNHGGDFLSRFPSPFGNRSFEDLYRYYTDKVGASLDPESGLAQVQVQAFTPADAYQINARLLELSEALVNRLNERAEERGIAEAERRVNEAEVRVSTARVALSNYRNEHELLDPTRQAAGVLDISNKLVAEQAALQAQLDLMRRVAPRNPSIPTVENRIVSIGREIAAQNGRAVGTPTGIASELGTYEKLNAEQDFANQMLTAANASLEQARTEAQKQQFYLERVVQPNVPDDPTLPHRLAKILTVFGASLCLYFVAWMLIVGILEHSPDD